MLRRISSRSWLAIASVLLFAVAVWAWTAPRPASDALLTDDGKLEISPGRGFASYRNSSVQELRFHMTNRSQSNITIEAIDSSCGCTVVEQSAAQILAPGASTEFSVQVTVPPRGTQETLLAIRTPDRPYFLPMTLEGPPIAVPAIANFVRRVEIRSYAPGQAVQRDLELATTETRGTPPWIRGVESSNPRFQVRLGAPVDESFKSGTVRRIYPVSVDAVAPEFGQPSESTWLTLLADDHLKVSESARCLVTVESITPVRFLPSELLFAISETGNAAREKTVHILSELPDSLELELLQPEAEWLAAEILQTESKQAAILRVSLKDLPDDFAEDFLRTELKVRTGFREDSELILPITVSR